MQETQFYMSFLSEFWIIYENNRLFLNCVTLVALYDFDTLERTSSQGSFIRESIYVFIHLNYCFHVVPLTTR